MPLRGSKMEFSLVDGWWYKLITVRGLVLDGHRVTVRNNSSNSLKLWAEVEFPTKTLSILFILTQLISALMNFGLDLFKHTYKKIS